eukprot:scaffold30508_cov119-Isochrysis_galbana.AAC.3
MRDDTRRLQKVGLDRCAENGAILRHVDLRELAEARRVLVQCTEFHRRLGRAYILEMLGHKRQMPQDQLASLGLTRSGRTRYHNSLAQPRVFVSVGRGTLHIAQYAAAIAHAECACLALSRRQ